MHAGWQYRDGALRNEKGEPFRIEMVENGGFFLRVLSAYGRNLEKLGIQLDIRTSDFALYQKRMNEYDFDMTTTRFPDSQNPGNELWDRFGSQAAKEKGSDNIRWRAESDHRAWRYPRWLRPSCRRHHGSSGTSSGWRPAHKGQRGQCKTWRRWTFLNYKE
jgi:ABC-type transport system substrate-binding protein